MPRRSTRSRQGMSVINSIKNVRGNAFGITSTNSVQVLAKAVNTPLSTVNNDVSNGCKIFRMWLSFDVCGLAASGVLNVADIFLMKNPGDNLTPPGAGATGTSNEKKFIIKQWQAMIMRNQDGNVPYHWEGWIKIPKNYQRMGTDDVWNLVFACTAAVTGHAAFKVIYKWFR